MKEIDTVFHFIVCASNILSNIPLYDLVNNIRVSSFVFPVSANYSSDQALSEIHTTYETPRNYRPNI